MDHDWPPAGLLRAAGIVVLPEDIRPREGRAWLVDWHGTHGILRQLPAPTTSTSLAERISDVIWLHAFLTRLATLGFPSPRPLPAFGESSWTCADGHLWEMVSFVPGHVVGWAAEPSMEEIGGLLARYHAAVRQLETRGQRPGALPLAEVSSILESRRLLAARVSPDRAAVIRHHAERLDRNLAGTGHLAHERVVIHGDFTNHNVIADGRPPRATGVIDFAGAHVETPLADIGYGLWRSGRPFQAADHLDLSRVRPFLRGYVGQAADLCR